MEVQNITIPAAQVGPFRFKCDGNFIKIESVPSGNAIYIKTSENETFLGYQTRSIEFERIFNWIEITGAAAGESIVLQTGRGWIMDSPDPLNAADVNVLTMPNVYLQYDVRTLQTVPAAGELQMNIPPVFPAAIIWVEGAGTIDITLDRVFIGNIAHSVGALVIVYDENHNPVVGNNITAGGIYYVQCYGTSGFFWTNNDPADDVSVSHNFVQQPLTFL